MKREKALIMAARELQTSANDLMSLAETLSDEAATIARSLEARERNKRLVAAEDDKGAVVPPMAIRGIVRNNEVKTLDYVVVKLGGVRVLLTEGSMNLRREGIHD